ncbi:MAG: hypothetical protein U9N59_04390 [Campylobacterota bacterium]|nr:hypothetical protein [Campylobacterota bacterium]
MFLSKLIKYSFFILLSSSFLLGYDIDFGAINSISKQDDVIVNSQIEDIEKTSNEEENKMYNARKKTLTKFLSAGSSKVTCHSIENKDRKYQCLAQTKHNPNKCYSINNKNRMRMCLAITKSNVGGCYSIRNNKDLMYSCKAQTNNDKDQCYSVRNKDDRYECLAITTHNKKQCHSIKNKDNRYACLAEF